jgi:hypothetical protein
MSEDQQFRQFLGEAVAKARTFSESQHISNEVRDVLKDFIEIAGQFERLISARNDGGADQRRLTKKFDALKAEHRESQKHVEKLKGILTTDLISVFKAFTAEAVHLDSLDEKFPDAGLKSSSQRIKAALANLLETIKKA